MRTRSAVRGICFIISLALLAAGSRATATLGEVAESVETDRKALVASLRSVTKGSKYTIHEIRSGAVRIREYVSSSGMVFAVAWNGPVPPDLTVLFGSYASEYHEAERKAIHRPGRRSRVVNTRNITVARWGHMGNLRGHAYIDALVPSGVDIHEIQ